VTTTAVFFPFDLFGSPGAGAGAELLADAFRELLTDNRRERVPTRGDAYTGQVKVREFTFETLADLQDWRPRARRVARQIFQKGHFLLWITGNHLGVLPVYEELARQCPDALVFQFDAHLDIHHFTDCTAELSHGNFLLHGDGPLPALVNLGHRDLLLPADYVAKHYQAAYSAEALVVEPEPIVNKVRQAARKRERVFLDLDCDVFDPAFFHGVTHPVPFGLSPPMLLQLIDAVWSERVIGVAVSEFAPGRDHNDQSLATLVWFLEYLLLKHYEPRGKRVRDP
jgi:arginase family enzyme